MRIISCLFFLFISFQGNCQLDFIHSLDTTNIARGSEVRFGDFDGNGYKDVAFATESRVLALYVLFNFAGTLSKTPIKVTQDEDMETDAYYYPPFAVTDLDQDGKDEIIYYAYTKGSVDNRVKIFKYDNAKFKVDRSLTTNNSSYCNKLLSGNFNGDDIPDFILIANELHLYESDTSEYSIRSIPTPEIRPYKGEAVDINHDGSTDLILYDTDFKISIYLSNGNGSFSFSRSLKTSGSVITRLLFEDFNKDGRIDISSISSPNEPKIDIFYQSAAGDFTVATMALEGSFFDGATADIDEDGYKDIILTGIVNTPISVRGIAYLINKNPGFEYSFHKSILGSTSNFTSISLDNKSKPQLVGLNHTGKAIVGFQPNPDAPFRSLNIPFSYSGNQACIKDINRDGLDDIVIANIFGSSISYSLNTGNGSLSPPEFFSTTFLPSGIASDDFNNDGYPDIVYCGDSQTFMYGIILSDSRGGFKPPVEFFGNSLNKISVNDFNKDGNRDFFSYNQVNYGNGKGAFTRYDVGPSSINTFATGDFNHDGFGDVVTGGNSGFSIYTGKSGNSLNTGVNFLTNKPVFQLAAVDVNSDGYSDLLISGFGSPTILYINQKNGKFNEMPLSISNDYYDMAAADFNRDGLIDLAYSADSNRGTFSILSGKLDGSFNSPIDFAISPSSIYALYAAKINSDQKPDLIAIQFDSPVHIFINDLIIEPTSPPSGLEVTAVTDSSAQISLKSGNGNGRLLAIREGASNQPPPIDRTFYSPNTAFGLGSDLGNGNYVTSFGQSTTTSIVNLKENTTYSLRAYEFSENSNHTEINYLTSSYASLTFTTKISQKITVDSIPFKTMGEAPFSVAANATSGLLVSTEVVSGDVKFSSGKITINGPGPVTLRLTQSGNEKYAPAPPVQVTFCVNPIKPTINYTSISGNKFRLMSSNTSNNAWIKNGELLEGLTTPSITVEPDGVYKVKVDYSGCYNISDSVANQTITFPSITTKEIGQPDFILIANSTSGLPITYSIVSGGAEINDSIVSIITPGPVKIKASQAGSSFFFPAATVEVDFCINPAKPTIEISSPTPDNFTLTSSSDTNNNWLRNNEMIAGATKKIYAVVEEGIYTVMVNFSGCSNTSLPSPFKITGLDEVVQFIYTYPNPTDGPINITWPYSNDNLKLIQLLDLHGKSNSLVFRKEGQLTKIDISDFPAGLYGLQLHSDKGSITLKVLKK